MNVVSPFVNVKPGQSASPVCINILKQSSSSAPFTNLETTLTLHTNLSFFHLPFCLYSGLLSVRFKLFSLFLYFFVLHLA